MNALSTRIVAYLLVPAGLGGVMGWIYRSNGGVSSVDAARMTSHAKQDAEKDSWKKRPAAVSPDSPLAEQRRFCERLKGANMEQIQALYEEVQTFEDAFRRRSSREAVLEQMARTDGLAGAVYMEKWSGGYQRDFLAAWGRVDAEAALSWAEGQGKAAGKHIQSIVGGLLPEEVEAFCSILPRLKAELLDPSQMETAFYSLAGEDSARALKLCEGIAPGKQQNVAAGSLAEGWARRDTSGAYAWAKAIEDPSQRESALRGVFRAWAETDPQGVAAKLDELSKDGSLKDVSGESPVRAVVRAWAAQDPKAAAAWLRARPGGGNNDEFNQLLNKEILPSREEWAATDLADMLRKPGDLSMTEQKKNAFGSMNARSYGSAIYGNAGDYITYGDFTNNSPLGRFGDPYEANQSLRLADPAKAFEELSKQPGDVSRQQVLEAVASQWVAQDPKAALAKLQQTNDEWLKLGLINALSNQARQTSDPVLAGKVAEAFPEAAGMRSDFLGEFYSSIAQVDPQRARAVLDSDIDAAAKSQIASALAAQQATYDPGGAIEWAAQQKDPSLQITAMNSAFSEWAQADAYAASEWLTAQPAGPLREAAVRGLVGVLKGNSPDDALQWASSLVDPQKREQEQVSIVNNMVWRNPQKARQLMDGLQVSDQKKKELEQAIQSRELNAN